MATVLIVGSGGREHTLAAKMSESSHVDTVLVSPGNPGMADVATCVPGRDVDQWCRIAQEHDVDLVVIGPEVPLVDGLADRLRALGVLVFGPGADAARLEGDKAFAKEFMAAAGIPTAAAEVCTDVDAAIARAQAMDGRCVVKATGLAAGKGVTVCSRPDQAEQAIRDALESRVFGEAGASVLIEERLEGPELSVFAVVDGERLAWFVPSRDYKRLADGGVGPNTGGMGAYTPVADATEPLMQAVESEVLKPSLAQLRARGLDYRGLLYVGLMLTADGPKVLEYNCRFGDPETQVVLPAYDGDLYTLLASAARGQLTQEGQLPSKGCAVGVVAAAANYPQTPRAGDRIVGLDQVAPPVRVFHAGTAREGDTWTTAGGRVLAVVATAGNLDAARSEAYRAVDRIQFDGRQVRTDIALLNEER